MARPSRLSRPLARGRVKCVEGRHTSAIDGSSTRIGVGLVQAAREVVLGRELAERDEHDPQDALVADDHRPPRGGERVGGRGAGALAARPRAAPCPAPGRRTGPRASPRTPGRRARGRPRGRRPRSGRSRPRSGARRRSAARRSRRRSPARCRARGSAGWRRRRRCRRRRAAAAARARLLAARRRERDVRAPGVRHARRALGLPVAHEVDRVAPSDRLAASTQRRSASARWIASSSACTRSPSCSDGSGSAPSRIAAWKLRATMLEGVLRARLQRPLGLQLLAGAAPRAGACRRPGARCPASPWNSSTSPRAWRAVEVRLTWARPPPRKRMRIA